jgi:hypothetical protein
VTVKTAVFVVVPKVAEIVTDVVTVTELVVIEKFAVVLPAATVILAGTDTFASELAIATEIPPGGAGPLRVITLEVVIFPPLTDAGESEIADTAVGVTVSTAVLFSPP